MSNLNPNFRKRGKPGAPPVPDHLRRSKKITANFNEGELEKLHQNAKRAELNIGCYLRAAALTTTGGVENSAVTTALNAIASELNAISCRAAGSGEQITSQQAAELVALNQTLIKRLGQLKRLLEG